MSAESRADIPRGTLDMLILTTLGRGPRMHGFEIANAIQQSTENVLHVEEGSLYPALQRMLIKGWLTAEWGKTDENRRARYYRLTAAGRKQAQIEVAQYTRVAQAIARVVQPA